MTPTSRVSDAMFDAAKKVIVEDDCFYVTDAAIRLALEAALSTMGDVDAYRENQALQKALCMGWRMGQDDDASTFNKTLLAYETEAREMRKNGDLSAILNRGGK